MNAVFPDGSVSRSIQLQGLGNGPAPCSDLSILQREIAIIIPVYNAPEDLETCLKQLFRHTPPNARYILVDDNSPDSRIGEIFAQLANRPEILLLKNETNLGFSGSVNKGICAAGKMDVCILNSDARVTPRWLQSMLLAAASQPRVATVTAMSDRAGAFSAPLMGNSNHLPDGSSEEDYAVAFRRASLGLLPTVPTGNGFCMYMSRAAINEIGLLDAEAFPRGYGEENDFCMRALRAGWANIIDDRSYVFHARGQSFGESRNELIQKGRAVIYERYPEYGAAIGIFSHGAKLALARWAGAVALKNWRQLVKPRILVIAGDQSGGTSMSTMDLLAELSKSAQCYLLFCDGRAMRLRSFRRAY